MQTYLNNTFFETLIFDLDGTLYPRIIYLSEYYNFALKASKELLGLSDDEAKVFLESGNIFQNPIGEPGSVSSLLVRRGISLRNWNDYRNKYFDISIHVSLDIELVGTLQTLSKLYKLALITNNTSKITRQILNKLGLLETIFSVILTSDDNIALKPDIQSFAYVLKRLGTQPKSMLSIGDRYNVDIAPVLTIGGSGVLVYEPHEITEFSEKYLVVSHC